MRYETPLEEEMPKEEAALYSAAREFASAEAGFDQGSGDLARIDTAARALRHAAHRYHTRARRTVD